MEKLNIFDLLIKYNDDLFRADSSTYDFLSNHFDEYIDDYKSAINNSKQILESRYKIFDNIIFKIRECADSVRDVLNEIQSNNLKSSIHKAYALFEANKGYLPLIPELHTNEFYHMRNGTDFDFEDRLQMFHINNNNKSIISAHRYNFPGEPCWYLANDLYLCWLECDMPNEAAWCKIKAKEEYPLKVVNFFRWGLDSLYMLKENFFFQNEEEKINAINEIIKYYITYPIFAACSLKVEDRSKNFVSEYVFPQLFMQWLKEKTDFDGVAYSSELYSDLYKGKCHNGNPIFNLAIANRSFKDGYDRETAKKYLMSDIKKFDMVKELYDSDMIELKKNCICLIHKINSKLFFETNTIDRILPLYMQIESVSKLTLLLCDSIIEKKDYRTIEIVSNEICMHAELISNKFKGINDEIFDIYNKAVLPQIMPFKIKCDIIFAKMNNTLETSSEIL